MSIHVRIKLGKPLPLANQNIEDRATSLFVREFFFNSKNLGLKHKK